jgi:hypothetical protein
MHEASKRATRLPADTNECHPLPRSANGCQRVVCRPVEHEWSTRDRADDNAANQCQAVPTADNHCQPLTEHSKDHLGGLCIGRSPPAARLNPATPLHRLHTTPGYSA